VGCILRRCLGVSSASDTGMAGPHSLYDGVLAVHVCLLLHWRVCNELSLA